MENIKIEETEFSNDLLDIELFEEMEIKNSERVELTDEDIAKMNVLRNKESFWDYESQEIILGGADTLEEIEALFVIAIKDMIAKKEKTLLNEARSAILKKGSLTSDGKMWFNYDSASMFIQAFSTLDSTEKLPWYNAQRVKVILTYAQAKAYAKEIRTVLQTVYGLGA